MGKGDKGNNYGWKMSEKNLKWGGISKSKKKEGGSLFPLVKKPG